MTDQKFPYVVTIHTNDYSMVLDRTSWLQEHVGSNGKDWWDEVAYHQLTVFFKRESDAVAFKLAFG